MKSKLRGIVRRRLISLRREWSGSSLGCESSFHQLAPYIGKLKTSIARALLSTYAAPNTTVLDPFSGSGVVPLEAAAQGLNTLANDLSPYAAVLTQAKLFPPRSEFEAIKKAVRYVRQAKIVAERLHYKVRAPAWVKGFFHRRTLAETYALTQILRRRKEWFLLACVLGILHHQRPGFLSYPSSHLVPYLRTRKFPRKRFPALYAYRDVEPRLVAKVRRAYRHFYLFPRSRIRRFSQEDICDLTVPNRVGLVLTSPPYMNALDYGRDNRLRLWFLGVENSRELDNRNCRTPEEFSKLMRRLAFLADHCLTSSGKVVLVVGEVRRRRESIDTSAIVKRVFTEENEFILVDSMEDMVPDVRRSRRHCSGTKREWVLVFSRRKKQL